MSAQPNAVPVIKRAILPDEGYFVGFRSATTGKSIALQITQQTYKEIGTVGASMRECGFPDDATSKEAKDACNALFISKIDALLKPYGFAILDTDTWFYGNAWSGVVFDTPTGVLADMGDYFPGNEKIIPLLKLEQGQIMVLRQESTFNGTTVSLCADDVENPILFKVFE